MKIHELKVLVKLGLLPRYLATGWTEQKLRELERAKVQLTKSDCEHHRSMCDPLNDLRGLNARMFIILFLNISAIVFINIVIWGKKFHPDEATIWTVFQVGFALMGIAVAWAATRGNRWLCGKFAADISELCTATKTDIRTLITSDEDAGRKIIEAKLTEIASELESSERNFGRMSDAAIRARAIYERGWSIACKFDLADDKGLHFKNTEVAGAIASEPSTAVSS